MFFCSRGVIFQLFAWLFRFGFGYTLMLKISPPDAQAMSSGPPSPIAALHNDADYFNHPSTGASDVRI